MLGINHFVGLTCVESFLGELPLSTQPHTRTYFLHLDPSVYKCVIISKYLPFQTKVKVMTFEYMTDHCNNAEPSHSALKFFKYKLRASESCSNKMSISLLLEFLSLTRYV